MLPLKNSKRREELCGNLEESLDIVEITDDIEMSWRSLRNVVYSSSFEILGPPVHKHQDWFDDNNESVKKLIKQMHDMHRTWIDDRNSSVKHQAYKKCKSEIQIALRNMKDSWLTSRAAEPQQAAEKDSKAFYEGLRKVYGSRDGGNSLVLSDDGRTL